MFITKNALLFCVFLLSRSSRSAWIEIIPLAFLSKKLESRSSRSAWIEIRKDEFVPGLVPQSRSSRSAWIEILDPSVCYPHQSKSRSSRSAWIEIMDDGIYIITVPEVALLAERVD